ncbi:MAG: mechanosensitive ion channel protein MscS [Acidobacteria bacterium SCN 69-37]|nr:MAG: mechanosensitive ion channel protein MscS [Acidobacteria bacterium SCN 69-37]
MRTYLPVWIEDQLGVIVPVGHVLLILLTAWILQRIVRRLIKRIGTRYALPPELAVVARRASSFVIYGAALLLALERLGVSRDVLWGAFTGFAAVGAVAFFAAWSVLSNIFCALLIVTTRPFRLFDYIELLDSSDKPGFRGQVIDINIIYTTLQDVPTAGNAPGSVLQIPNSLFFQRSVRRWRGSEMPSHWIETM